MSTIRQRRQPQQQFAPSIPRVPPPSHRHAAPTGPWPFLNLGDPIERSQLEDSAVIDTPALHAFSPRPGIVALPNVISDPTHLNAATSENPDATPSIFTTTTNKDDGNDQHGSENIVVDDAHSPQLSQRQNNVSSGDASASSLPAWTGYPQHHFPNWTESQQERSGIQQMRKQKHSSKVYTADVFTDGIFKIGPELNVNVGTKRSPSLEEESTSTAAPTDNQGNDSVDDFWKAIDAPRPDNSLLRAYFVEDLSGPALQMLGSRFVVEPFFWSSFLKWIPSRHFQAENDNKSGPKGEHITITLTFIKSVKKQNGDNYEGFLQSRRRTSDSYSHSVEQAIDIQAPLLLGSQQDRMLIQDCLALHLVKVRHNEGGPSTTSDSSQKETSTLISLHPRKEYRTTSASNLHSRFIAVGRSVYWSNMLSGQVTTATAPPPEDKHHPLSSLIFPTSQSSLLKRQDSGSSSAPRPNTARGRRNSRDSHGHRPLDGPIRSGHRRLSSVGSFHMPDFSLEEVDEDAVAEDEEDFEMPRSQTPELLHHNPNEGESPVRGEIPPGPTPSAAAGTPVIHSPPRHTQSYWLSSPSRQVSTPRLVSGSPLTLPGRLSPNPPKQPKPADPTLIMLSMLWHALYCWDEAFEHLIFHVVQLEGQTMEFTDERSDARGIREGMDHEDISRVHNSQSEELFLIQAHLLHYASLLADFRKSVGFLEGAALGTGGESMSYVLRKKNRMRGGGLVNSRSGKRQDTYSKFGRDEDEVTENIFGSIEDNRSMPYEPEDFIGEEDSESSWESQQSRRTMNAECSRLVDEIERLERQRAGLENRLKNLMNLSYSRINIQDSQDMRRLTEASLRDNAAMKQISYLSMIFLPATFVATVFGMNVTDLKPDSFETFEHYFEVVIPFSVASVWLIVAMQLAYQKRYVDYSSGEDRKQIFLDVFSSLSWPYTSFMKILKSLSPWTKFEKAFKIGDHLQRRAQRQANAGEIMMDHVA